MCRDWVKSILVALPGYVGKYTIEYRVIAAKVIGRPLRRGEVILHIGDKKDDRPENLFLCASMSEYSRRRQGSLPWPKTSNLETFKE